MTLELVALAGMAGFTLGYFAGRSDRLHPVKSAHLVTVPITQNEFQPPAKLAEDGAMVPPAPSAIERQHWDLKLCAFALAGDMVEPKFSLRKLRGKFCSESTWEVYTGILSDLGAIEKRPRAATRWAQGWGPRHLRMMIKHGLINPPYPPGAPPACGWTG